MWAGAKESVGGAVRHSPLVRMGHIMTSRPTTMANDDQITEVRHGPPAATIPTNRDTVKRRALENDFHILGELACHDQPWACYQGGNAYR